MQKTKDQLIEEIRENLYMNLSDDSGAVADALLDSHYPNLDSMSIEDVQRAYNFEFNLDDTKEFIRSPQIVYVLTDDLSYMSIHATLNAAEKAQHELAEMDSESTSWITEMEVEV
jgi:hypothetical protein